MSSKERQRLKVVERVMRSETTLLEASRQLGLSYRQTIRIRDRLIPPHASRGAENGLQRAHILYLFREPTGGRLGPVGPT